VPDVAVRMIPIADLRDHPRNSNRHGEHQLAVLEARFRALGWYKNVVVAEWEGTTTLLAGHGVTRGAERAGETVAPCHVRKIDPSAAKALRKSLQANGLVETLVWNRRTGNLVGGHQRIEQIDALEGRDDYDLTMSIVDVDEHDEQNINLALNNRNLQGEWDEDALAELLAGRTEEDQAAHGFAKIDLDYLLNPTGAVSMMTRDSTERQETKDKLDEIKQDRAAMNSRLREDNAIDFYATVLFADAAERDLFYKAFGLMPGDNYIRGIDLARRLPGWGGG
jgi:hypothetical protein